MANTFSSGKHSICICDRCGFRFKLKELKPLTIKLKKVNLRACPDCWEKDHPQLQVGMYPVNDPQAIQNARPDSSFYTTAPGGDNGSRQTQWGWKPVGGGDYTVNKVNPLISTCAVGTVSIS